jgi:tetratricopeptide (TPR) repeat protein
MPMLALGIFWFALTVLPVSNLLFPTGVLLAERTLYLPSVGLALVVAGALPAMRDLGTGVRRVALVVGATVLLALTARTVARNPAWESTRAVLETLNRDHPESHLVFLERGLGLEETGDLEGARAELEMALRLAPARYGTLTAVAGFLGRREEWAAAETLLRRAIIMAPARDDAYRLLSAHLLRQGDGRRAHGAALAGLARSGFHPDLWGAVSESYVLKGDLGAAVRAREAAVAADPLSAFHRERLADLLEAMGDQDGAEAARDRGTTLKNLSGPQSSGRQESIGPGSRAARDAGQSRNSGGIPS